MRERKVWKENGKIFSQTIDRADYSKSEGGKIVKTVLFEMDEKEARRQLKWVEEEYEKAKKELKKLKESITRKGIQDYLNEQRKKIKQIREHFDEMKNLKEQYDKALSS